MSIKNTSGFTLIELLIAVTLSAILMTGIVIFVGSSLGSNMETKRTIEEGNTNEGFEQRFNETMENISRNGIYATGSNFGEYSTGIFLSTQGSNLPVTFLGIKTETGYCDSYSGTSSETGTVMKLILKQFSVPNIQNSTSYTLSSIGNSILSGSTRIVGTGKKGDILGNKGIDTELSSPSALISSGTHLYIADTMNDRVLSYDITSGNIIKLLGAENGLSKPTSLYFSGSTLLIASGGNGKIFSLQDGEINGSTFSSNFKVAKNFSANTLKFIFSGIPSIISPTFSGSFSFNGISGTSDDTINTGASLQYTFLGGTKSFLAGSTYGISINNISPIPTNPGNNTVQIDFYNGATLQYSDTFHHLIKGDGSLESNTGNILKVFSSGLIYPYNITGPSSWSGTISNWNTIFSGNPPGEEIISSFPVQDVTFQVTGKILTIRYHEYSNYDCLLEKHQIKERIRKILLP